MWEPLQDFAAQRVGRNQAGGFGPLGSAALDLEECHRVYITAHSPRPHPGSSHPPTGSSGLGPQGLRYQTPPTATHCPLATCVLGRSGSELVSAHLGRWSTLKTVQARIDPSRGTGESELPPISCRFLRVPASTCQFLLRGTFCSREILSMFSPMLRCNARKWAHGWCIVGSIYQSEGISAREDAEKDLHPHRTIGRLG